MSFDYRPAVNKFSFKNKLNPSQTIQTKTSENDGKQFAFG
jgi:hypothetical protein